MLGNRDGVEQGNYFEGILEETCKKFRVSREQILNGSRDRDISKARRVFFLRAHEEAGQFFTCLAGLCGFSHTSVREAIAKARMELQEEKYSSKPTSVPRFHANVAPPHGQRAGVEVTTGC